MTPTETARAALLKALDALNEQLPELPKPAHIFAYAEPVPGSLRQTIFETPYYSAFQVRFAQAEARDPACRVIEQALADLAADEPPTASMDEKALEIANRIARDPPDKPQQVISKIQVAVIEGMQWMRSQEREHGANMKDAERWRELLRQNLLFPHTIHIQVMEFGAPINYSNEGITAFIDRAILSD